MAKNRVWAHSQAVRRGRKELAIRKTVKAENGDNRAEAQRCAEDEGLQWGLQLWALWWEVWPFFVGTMVFVVVLLILMWLFLRGVA